MIIKIKKMSDDVVLPAYAHAGDAGVDLRSVEEILIKSGEYCLIKTGLCIEMPSGTEGQIRPRSGLALKYGVTVLNSPGTIDADYRGESVYY